MMLLYEHPLSSYAQKVKIALREKGLDFKVETPAALGSGKVAAVGAWYPVSGQALKAVAGSKPLPTKQRPWSPKAGSASAR